MQTIERHDWREEGYRPLVHYGGWQVALLNHDASMDLANLGQIERHKETDEVFVLVSGRACLYARREDGPMAVEDLKPGVVYNIPRGVWHNLLAAPEASLVIVEDRGTDLSDTEIRPLSDSEAGDIRAALPAWLRQPSGSAGRHP
jgi:mannose-6-phosphate isomerase-like protein (cupin superfamily)